MRDEDRFDRYLSARAAVLELPPAGIASVMDRAARRHRHRRAAVSACTAAAVLGGALSVANLGGAPTTEQVVSQPANGVLVESSLAWASVTPKVGLSWSNSSVVGPGNAVYSLSTAPGVVTNSEVQLPATLYRSTDGIEWKAATLPENLNASSLATTAQYLYAIGTAPAGGSTRAVQLASTNAAGASWSRATLPFNVDALEARYHVKIGLNGLKVASNGTLVVASVGVQVNDGIDRYLPADVDVSQGGYGVSESGIEVYGAPTPVEKPTAPEVNPDGRRIKAPSIVASFTWDQLGIDATLRSLILGETRMFVADDGATFTETALPSSVRVLGALLSTTDGFELLGSTTLNTETTQAWSSTDGHSWVADPAATTPGYVVTAGTRRGDAAVVLGTDSSTSDSAATVSVRSGHTWNTLRLTDLVHRAGFDGEFYISSAAVGPLGTAVVLSTYGVGQAPHSYLVTTPDGVEASVTDLSTLLGDRYPGDVRVTADAITVTVNANDGQAPVQLLVGTPKR